MTILDKIRKFDMFKQSVYLTFNGRKSYATVLGTFMTFISILLWSIYGFLLLSKMWNKTQVIWNTNTYYINLVEDEEVITLTKDDPKIKINYSFNFTGEDLAQNLTFKNLVNMEMYRDSEFPMFRYSKDITPNRENQFLNWSENFPLSLTYQSIIEHNNFREGTYDPNFMQDPVHCPNFEGFKLAGSIESTKTFMQIIGGSGPWFTGNPHEHWGGEHELDIDRIFGNSSMNIYIKNKFVDLNDIENPIKEHVEEFQLHNVTGGGQFEFEAITNEVTLEDSFWPSLSDPEPIKFITFKPKRTSMHNYSFFIYYIKKSDKVIQYKRQVLSFLEVFGTLGGIFELFEIAFGVLVGFYSSWLFKRDISKKFDLTGKEIEELKEKLERVKSEIFKKREEDKQESPEDPCDRYEGWEEEKISHNPSDLQHHE